jgi:hypothetical protein
MLCIDAVMPKLKNPILPSWGISVAWASVPECTLNDAAPVHLSDA